MKTREINPQQKMAQVITTARNLFVTKGFHNVSIPQIVKASGVSIGAIYHHFGNKEGLAKQVHEQTLHQFQESLKERLVPCTDTRQKLDAFGNLVFEVTEQNPEMMEYMLLMNHREFLADEPPICSTEPFRLVQAIIDAGIAREELKSGDSFIAAIAFTGVILRAVELRLTGVLTQKLTDISEDLLNHAWLAIKA